VGARKFRKGVFVPGSSWLDNFLTCGREGLDIESRRRLRLLNWAGLSMSSVLAAWVVVQISYSAWILVAWQIGFALTTLVLLIVLRLTLATEVIAHLMSLVLLLVVTNSAYYTGGPTGANTSLFLLIPVGAVSVAGRHGLWWTLPALVAVIVMEWAQKNGYVFYNLVTEEERWLDALLTWITALGVISFLIFQFERVRDKAARESGLAREMAEEASRIKSQFVANISHEIRTPLHGILGVLDLVESEQDPSARKKLTAVARESGKLLIDVVNDVLDLSRIEAGKIELRLVDFTLARTLDQVVFLASEPAHQKGLMLKQEIEPDLPERISGDSVHLRQVLLNMMSNAVKYTEKGRIVLRVSCSRRDPEKIWLRFEVQDSGIGIEADQVDRVFEPFVQADGSSTRPHGGAGLGLAISRQLVRLMGSELRVSSQPGKGSRFWFEIEVEPAASKPERQASDEPPATSEPYKPGDDQPSVLVVEDNVINRKLAVVMLEKIGCRVSVADDGQQALAQIEHEKFDLILMDCQMPVMDGLEATRQIRKNEKAAGHGHIPIVALTAHAMENERQICFEAGMDDYLSKPFSKKDIQRIVIKWTSKEGLN